MITITRKIKLNIEGDAKVTFEKLYRWNEFVFRAANYASTHLYIQNNLKEFFYFTEDFKIKLANVEKDEQGILTTSGTNSTYQMLSSKFKGDIPMDIVTNLNNVINQSFNKRKKDLFKGTVSLSSYKRDIPIPFSSTSMKNISLTQDGKNYSFELFGLKFNTYFGRDFSGNKIIFERSLLGEYKLCNSSIQIENKKIYLLAVFQFEKQSVILSPDIEIKAELSSEVPIKYTIGSKTYEIGNKEEFLYRRLQIQYGLHRAQKNAKYNKGGKGRKKKMKSIEKYHLLEKNYVINKIHTYTHLLVEQCLKHKAGKLILLEQKEKEEKTLNDELLLRNWSYFAMKEKLKYKCEKYGIELIIT